MVLVFEQRAVPARLSKEISVQPPNGLRYLGNLFEGKLQSYFKN
jgi:hypothetical protein